MRKTLGIVGLLFLGGAAAFASSMGYSSRREEGTSGYPTVSGAITPTAAGIEINAPTGLAYSTATTTTVSASWNAASPVPDRYTFQVSTASDFTGTVGSSNTAALSATLTSLSVNATYYGRALSILNSSSSSWSSSITTATLANAPATAVSTWSLVGTTSFTTTWDANSNPTGTRYDIRIGTASDFTGTETSSETQNTNASYSSLTGGTTYYGRVKAVSHSGTSSGFVTLGSTKTATVGTVFVNDSFTDTDLTVLASHSPETGGPWVEHSSFTAGEYAIHTNRAVTPSAASAACNVASGAPLDADYDVEATFRVLSTAYNTVGQGIAARVTSSTVHTLIFARYNSSGWQLFETVAAASTQLFHTVAQTLSAGNDYAVKLALRGNTATLSVDGVEIMTSTTAVTSAGLVGVRGTSASSTTGIAIANITATDR